MKRAICAVACLTHFLFAFLVIIFHFYYFEEVNINALVLCGVFQFFNVVTALKFYQAISEEVIPMFGTEWICISMGCFLCSTILSLLLIPFFRIVQGVYSCLRLGFDFYLYWTIHRANNNVVLLTS